MYKSFLFLLCFVFSSSLFAYCPPCECTENISKLESQKYQQEIDKTIKEKIDTKIEEISKRAKEAKELQRKINEKLAKLQNIQTHIYILNKEKNHNLEAIKEEISSGFDISTVESKAISERIRTKINILSSFQSIDINSTVEDYIKK